MDSKNNVIPFAQRSQKGRRQVQGSGKAAGQLVDMTERRNEILNQERREVRRTILSEFIGASVVIPEKGLHAVTIYDVSENGISFDLNLESGPFRVGEEIAMRVYMNQQTYFPFMVMISNVRYLQDESIYRHGGGFVKGSVNEEALYHFVKFIESVSASLRRDNGDVMVSKLVR